MALFPFWKTNNNLSPLNRYYGFLAIGSVLLIFLLLPILALSWHAIEYKFWQNLSPALWASIKLSLQTSLISCLVVLIFGTPLAFYFSVNKDKKLIQYLQLICDLPLALPPAVAGLSLLVVFSPVGWLGESLQDLGITIAFSTKAVILAQIFVITPFFIRASRLGFDQLDSSVIAAATIDGASAWQSFFYIALPCSKPAIIGGVTICWLRAFGEFGTTAMFAGNLPGVSQTVSMFIYDNLAIDWEIGIALSFLVMIICWIGLFLTKQLIRN
ncbi:MAG: ABC transporter permease subunit [SAR324 cluster bacterium]|nr:ABC transporter permease subunit [SAR324 cluster bacterium]